MNKLRILTLVIFFLLCSATYAQKKKGAAIQTGKVCEIRISEGSVERLDEAIELARSQRDTVKVTSVAARRIIYVNLKTGSKVNDKTLKALYEKADITTEKISCMLL